MTRLLKRPRPKTVLVHNRYCIGEMIIFLVLRIERSLPQEILVTIIRLKSEYHDFGYSLENNRSSELKHQKTTVYSYPTVSIFSIAQVYIF